MNKLDIQKDFKEKDSDVVSRFWDVHNSHKLTNEKWTIEQSIEVILPLIYDEGYKYGYGKERWLREETIRIARKELKEELSEKIRGLKKEPDCGQNPNYPQDQCTPTCGHNNAINKILKLIQGL